MTDVLLVVWAIMGQLATFGLLVLKLVRSDVPLTTQVNAQTGEKRHGVFAWLGGLELLCVGPPVVIAILLGAAPYLLWAAEHWWLVPIAVVLAGSIWLVVRHILIMRAVDAAEAAAAAEQLQQQAPPHLPVAPWQQTPVDQTEHTQQLPAVPAPGAFLPPELQDGQNWDGKVRA